MGFFQRKKGESPSPDVHEIAAADHAGVGGHIMVKSAVPDAPREGVPDAVAHSPVMWWRFFDDMDRAVA